MFWLCDRIGSRQAREKQRSTAELQSSLPHLQNGANPTACLGRRHPRHRSQIGGWDQRLLLRLQGKGTLTALCKKRSLRARSTCSTGMSTSPELKTSGVSWGPLVEPQPPLGPYLLWPLPHG